MTITTLEKAQYLAGLVRNDKEWILSFDESSINLRTEQTGNNFINLTYGKPDGKESDPMVAFFHTLLNREDILLVEVEATGYYCISLQSKNYQQPKQQINATNYEQAIAQLK